MGRLGWKGKGIVGTFFRMVAYNFVCRWSRDTGILCWESGARTGLGKIIPSIMGRRAVGPEALTSLAVPKYEPLRV